MNKKTKQDRQINVLETLSNNKNKKYSISEWLVIINKNIKPQNVFSSNKHVGYIFSKIINKSNLKIVKTKIWIGSNACNIYYEVI